jgi:hypothetical protein
MAEHPSGQPSVEFALPGLEKLGTRDEDLGQIVEPDTNDQCAAKSTG